MSKYTHLLSNIGTPTEVQWNKMMISPCTKSKRDQLRRGIDDFSSFSWRGIDAFENFGAFIINEKNSLKFYNGPTYSNSYTKPQFDSAYGQLTGITFNVQKIEFNIGVYWITEKHYRQLIYWLNPYEINELSFGFDKDYYYQVKLASVSEGTRYILGKEKIQGTEDKYEYCYYTEMKLSFEVQGPACAYRTHAYEYKNNIDETSTTKPLKLEWILNEQSCSENSDLATPIEAFFSLHLYGTVPTKDDGTYEQDYFNVIFEAQYEENDPILLFDVSFKNQTYSRLNPLTLDLKYESDSGLLLLNVGDSEYMLLNQLSTSNYGKRIVESLTVNHFEIPGVFENPLFELQKLKFKVTVNSNVETRTGAETDLFNRWITKDDVEIISKGRTNLI